MIYIGSFIVHEKCSNTIKAAGSWHIFVRMAENAEIGGFSLKWKSRRDKIGEEVGEA